MKRYHVIITYQYYSKDNKPGRKLFVEKDYHSRGMALGYVDKIRKEKTAEFKGYDGGKLKHFKHKITIINI